MKRSAATICVVAMASFFLANALAAAEIQQMQATGKVISIDPQGTSIAILANVGKKSMEVRTTIDQDTVVEVKGKLSSVKDIDVGDTVTISYPIGDELHAKLIRKE